MTTEELVQQLTKPFFLFRMARGMDYPGRSDAQRKSAVKRKDAALSDIERIVADYCSNPEGHG